MRTEEEIRAKIIERHLRLGRDSMITNTEIIGGTIESEVNMLQLIDCTVYIKRSFLPGLAPSPCPIIKHSIIRGTKLPESTYILRCHILDEEVKTQ